MSAGGLSKSRLERMHQVLSGHIERNDIPGLVALVSRNNDVHVETLGALAFGEAPPMQRDTIFRIASITKPITAVAAMILVEECKLRLDDSIEPWLPELANRRVLKSISSDLDDTVPALRAITLRDLLTYRMGFGSVMADAGYLSDSEADPSISDRRRRPNAALRSAWHGRMAAEARLSAAAGATGRAMDVSRKRRCARSLDRAISGQSLGAFMREPRLRSAGHERHRFPCAASETRSLARVSIASISQNNKLDVFDDVANSAWRSSRPSNRVAAAWSQRSTTISPSAE